MRKNSLTGFTLLEILLIGLVVILFAATFMFRDRLTGRTPATQQTVSPISVSDSGDLQVIEQELDQTELEDIEEDMELLENDLENLY
jgi:hypothetical protein